MNKVICDVCGTDYPETAAQCPICGCARTDGNQTSAGNTETGEEERTHTYVKGGRFSKSNVRKRLKAAQIAQTRVPEPEYDDDDEDEDDEDEEGRSNFGLIAIVILLLLAIIAVSSYIAIVHFGLFDQADPTKPSISNTQPTGTKPSTSDTLKIPCTSLAMSDSEITLASVDSVWPLNYSVEPLDTTDQIIFVSADESVAVVDASGRVTAVGSGETTITATCGSFVVECRVICDFETENTDPTDPGDTTDPSDPVDVVILELKYDDVTLDRVFPKLQLYKGELDPSEIKWTSSREDVATVKDGLVTAVSLGSTKITAEYNGQKVSCAVHVSQSALDALKPDEPTDSTEPSVPAEATDPTETTEPVEPVETYSLKVDNSNPNYRIDDKENTADVTVYLSGKKNIELTIVNEMGAIMPDIIWEIANSDICVINGKVVTGLSVGKTTLTTTYEGVEFTVLVRVAE